MKKTVPYEMYLAEKTAREAEKAAYEAIISELRAKVEELVIKVAELEAKTNLNSKNSNKPPSSDGYSKSSPQNSRIKTGKKTGGQEGHEGKTLQLKEHPEEVAELKPDEQVCTCGGNVLTEETQYVRHQVIDIKKPTVTTTEYRQYEGICNMCGKIYRKEFPAEAANTIQYGSVIKATLTYLNVYQLIPLKRATELISDFYGYPYHRVQ